MVDITVASWSIVVPVVMYDINCGCMHAWSKRKATKRIYCHIVKVKPISCLQLLRSCSIILNQERDLNSLCHARDTIGQKGN